MEYAKLRVYENGGLIVFADVNGTVLSAEPKGTVRLKPFGATGFTFERITTGDGIAYVNSYDDVLDGAGVAWGANFTATLTALGAFFFIASELLASAVIYDNSASGLAATDMQAAVDEIVARDWTYQSGTYQTFLPNVAGGSTTVVASNVFRALIASPANDCSVNEVIVSIGTGAAGVGIVAIYELTSGTTGWTRIAYSAEFNTALTTNQYLAISASLKKGKIYAIGWIISSGGTPSMQMANLGAASDILGYAGTAGATSANNNALASLNTAVAYNAIPPATLTASPVAPASNILPFLRFKIA